MNSVWCGFADRTWTLMLSKKRETPPALLATIKTLGITLEEGVERKAKVLLRITENRNGITEGDPPINKNLTQRDYLFFLVYRFHHVHGKPSIPQWETLYHANELATPWGKEAQARITGLLEKSLPTGSYRTLRPNRQQLTDVMPQRDTSTSIPAVT